MNIQKASGGLLQKLTAKRPEGVDEKVAFENEVLESRYLGSIPTSHWSPFMGFGGYRHAPGGVGYGTPIYRDTPVYEPDGKPRVEVTEKHIKANPYSVPLFGALGAVGGGAVGAGLGALLAHFTGLPMGLVTGGAGAVGAVGGGLGLANYAAGDNVRLEWRDFPIQEKQLQGYYETVTPHYETRYRTVSDGNGKTHQESYQVQNGYDHTFSPDVRYWNVGSFVGPQVVHYQEKSGEWKPTDAPAKADGDKPIEGPAPKQPVGPVPPTDPPAAQ